MASAGAEEFFLEIEQVNQGNMTTKFLAAHDRLSATMMSIPVGCCNNSCARATKTISGRSFTPGNDLRLMAKSVVAAVSPCGSGLRVVRLLHMICTTLRGMY